MKGLRIIIITLLSAWLEVSFFGAWRPLGILPNLFLVVLLISSLIVPTSEALMMGLGGGLLLDFVSGSDFGLRTAYFCFLVLLIVVIRRTGADFERWSMKLAAIISATILYDAAILLTVLNSQLLQHFQIIGGIVVLETAFNVGLLIVLNRPLRYMLASPAPAMPLINQGR